MVEMFLQVALDEGYALLTVSVQTNLYVSAYTSFISITCLARLTAAQFSAVLKLQYSSISLSDMQNTTTLQQYTQFHFAWMWNESDLAA